MHACQCIACKIGRDSDTLGSLIIQVPIFALDN